MSTWQKIRVGIAGFSELLGFLLFCIFVYFAALIFLSVNGSEQSHLALVMWLSLLYSFCLFLGSAFLAISVKKVITPKSFKTLILPVLISGGLALTIYLLAMVNSLLE
jgi:hypothetical protein